MHSLASIFVAVGVVLLVLKLAHPYIPDINSGGAIIRVWEPPLEYGVAALLIGVVLWIAGSIIERLRKDRAEDKSRAESGPRQGQ